MSMLMVSQEYMYIYEKDIPSCCRVPWIDSTTSVGSSGLGDEIRMALFLALVLLTLITLLTMLTMLAYYAYFVYVILPS